MNNLADKVIAANNEQDKQPDDVMLDDIGFPLPKVETKKSHCEYLTARILYLNNRIYLHHGLLWLEHTPIKESKNSYYRLAKYPGSITDAECEYVWRRLKEIVPVLDTDKIAVLPNLTFNMKTGEVKEEEVWTITPWEEEK